MFLNLLIRNKLTYSQIEPYSNTVFLFVSLYIIYTNYYRIQYETSIQVMRLYIACDMFFIPFNKYDIIIHHILALSAIQYVLSLDTDISTDYYALSQLYTLEYSNIFLGMMYFLEPYKKLLFVNQLCFLLSFLKFRIYDFHNNVIFNNEFYTSIGTTIGTINYPSIIVVGLYALNIYWATVLIKIALKPFLKSVNKIYVESLLRYTYVMNALITIMGYTFKLDTQQKLQYGDYTLIDVSSNVLLACSSYLFHNFWYEELQHNSAYNHLNSTHLNYLIFDIFSIHCRIASQIYVNLHMNGIVDDYGILLSTFVWGSVFTLPTIYHIYNNSCIHQDTMTVKQKTDDYFILQCLYGIPPAYGIVISIIPVFNISYQCGYTLYLVYIIMVLMKVEPFYNFTQLSIHILMCVVNYLLVLNNTFTILNT